MQVTDTTAAWLTGALEGLLKLLGVDLAKLVGFGSDGAAVMTGTWTQCLLNLQHFQQV